MTIAALSSPSHTSTPTRWAELARARSTDRPEPGDKTERAERERERDDAPQRSPLLRALTAALKEVLAAEAPIKTDAAAPAAEAEADADTASSDAALEEAIADFARALMHALHEGRGHAHGLERGRRAWGDPAQRLERLAQPAPAAKPETAPAAETLPVTEPTAGAEPPATVPAAAAEPPVTATAPTSLSVTLTLKLELPESPWKSAHDGLIESFAEVQRALGRPDPRRSDDEDGQSLEARLREMLAALAAKLRANSLTAAALSPSGSLLSVVA